MVVSNLTLSLKLNHSVAKDRERSVVSRPGSDSKLMAGGSEKALFQRFRK